MAVEVDITKRPIPNEPPLDATNDRSRGQTRELARRLSGTLEVLLLWRPRFDQIELCIRDRAGDTSFRIAVAPASAMDAFHHPYVYAASANALSA